MPPLRLFGRQNQLVLNLTCSHRDTHCQLSAESLRFSLMLVRTKLPTLNRLHYDPESKCWPGKNLYALDISGLIHPYRHHNDPFEVNAGFVHWDLYWLFYLHQLLKHVWGQSRVPFSATTALSTNPSPKKAPSKHQQNALSSQRSTPLLNLDATQLDNVPAEALFLCEAA